MDDDHKHIIKETKAKNEKPSNTVESVSSEYLISRTIFNTIDIFLMLIYSNICTLGLLRNFLHYTSASLGVKSCENTCLVHILKLVCSHKHRKLIL